MWFALKRLKWFQESQKKKLVSGKDRARGDHSRVKLGHRGSILGRNYGTEQAIAGNSVSRKRLWADSSFSQVIVGDFCLSKAIAGRFISLEGDCRRFLFLAGKELFSGGLILGKTRAQTCSWATWSWQDSDKEEAIIRAGWAQSG